MGNPKQKWTAEEEDALKAGVAKHGAGKWKNIQRDPQFNHLLFSRSNIDLKDKWRNMSVANGQISREKTRVSKPKANPDAPATPLPVDASSTDIGVFDTPTDALTDESLRCTLDGKTASKYNDLIVEALSTLQDPNGSDVNSLISFIEERHDVPPNFRRSLTARLRRLVGLGKLQRTLNGYRIPRPGDTMPDVKGPIPKPKDVIQHHQGQPQWSGSYLGNSVEDAAVAAAYKIAEAENKSFVAAEAVKEADRVAEMAEDADAFWEFAKEIYERCSQGEIMTIV